MLYRCGRLIKFVYSLLLGIQLLALAANEIKRLKKMASFVINNSKKMRI
jgi:hypothetical protein